MPTWSQEQLTNARTIAQVGRQVGASPRDILIALMTSMQESGLKNLNYGDRDSVGLFQQRAGWAPLADRMDPVKSARMFFTGGLGDGTPGLLDFGERNGWSLTQAAQKVQVSAYPDAYAKHEDFARKLLGSLGDFNSSDIGEVDLNASALVGQNGDLDLFGDSGIGAASVDPVGKPMGIAAADAPGIESGDEMPEFDLGLDMFQGMDETTPSGGSTFQELFPQKGTTGGARERVGQLARQLLGTPYVWGGTDPDSGLDCSGFVQYVMKQVGVSLPRISADQARAGQRVGLDQLQAGDLVGWDNSARNNGADHIAIYLGNGLIIEAPRPGLGVRIRQLDDDEGDAWGVRLNY